MPAVPTGTGKPLAAKLGIAATHPYPVVNPPEGYETVLGRPVQPVALTALHGPYAFLHFFAKDHSSLESAFPLLKKALTPSGALWISWPKKSAREAGDPDENDIRAIGLAAGLVDVKVIAVDRIWSGLKFVYRLSDRPLAAR